MRGKNIVWIIGLVLGVSAAMPRAWADEPKYEKSDEFQKGKEDFGKDKPPVSIRLDQDQDQEARREAAAKPEPPAWLKGKTVGGWGGPAINYLQWDLGIFDPLTHDRRLNRFNDAMFPVGGFGVGRLGNLRIGGMGFGAGQGQDKVVSGEKRAADLSIGFGGLVVEYFIEPHPKLGLLAGTMLGGGSIGLSAKGDDIAEGKWSEDESFLAAYPYLGVSLKVLSFLRLEAVYGWSFFDFNPSADGFLLDRPNADAVDGTLAGGGSAQVRLAFGYETKLKP